MTGGTSAHRSRISSLQRGFEERIANPFFRSLLQSRIHWLASNWLMLLSYVGHRSHRRYTVPVAYKQIADGIVAVTPMEDSNWWKNFHDCHRCTVWVHGTEHAMTGEVVTGDERDALLGEYFDTYGIVGRMLGFGDNPAASPDHLDQVKQDLAVVQFTPNDE